MHDTNEGLWRESGNLVVVCDYTYVTTNFIANWYAEAQCKRKNTLISFTWYMNGV